MVKEWIKEVILSKVREMNNHYKNIEESTSATPLGCTGLPQSNPDSATPSLAEHMRPIEALSRRNGFQLFRKNANVSHLFLNLYATEQQLLFRLHFNRLMHIAVSCCITEPLLSPLIVVSDVSPLALLSCLLPRLVPPATSRPLRAHMVRTRAYAQGKPAKIANEAGGAVTAFGSYRLGVNDKCASNHSTALLQLLHTHSAVATWRFRTNPERAPYFIKHIIHILKKGKRKKLEQIAHLP